MFNIRDWTLREQHDLGVTAGSAFTGFVVSLVLLNTAGVTDLNARTAVTVSMMLFAAAAGYREGHFPQDPLVSEKKSVDFAVMGFGLLTVAALVYAEYDHVGALAMAVPVVLLLALPFYLVKTRRRSMLLNPALAREDLVTLTKTYIRMDLPSYRSFVKATYAEAAQKAETLKFDTKDMNAGDAALREKAVRASCRKAKTSVLRESLKAALEKPEVEINDQRIIVEAGRRLNREALDLRLITKEDFDDWEKRMNDIAATLPKSLQDIAE